MAFGEPKAPLLQGSREEILAQLESLPHVVKSYEKARDMMRREAIDIEDFVHPYGAEVLSRDVARVRKLEQEYERGLTVEKIYADIAEMIFYEHIEQSNWFGENVSTIKTSRYDDLLNGVDIIVEFHEKDQQALHMGLAVDITFGTNTAQKKIGEIKEKIQAGKLSEVKYFQSDHSPHKGLYQDLPRVVVGVDRAHILELSRMWIDERRKKEFSVHPVQKLILNEIFYQLTSFVNFAKACRQDKVARVYSQQLNIIQRIRSEKEGIALGSYQEDDGVYSSIQKQLELFA